MNAWTFLWLFLFLKIPIVALLTIVWWAIKQKPEEAPTEDDGGIRPRHRPPIRPTSRNPRHPRRRGPHGEPAPAAPARVRVTVARARRVSH
jgi:hypothetical protein